MGKTAKVDIDFSPAIQRLEAMASMFIQMGEAMVAMGEEIGDNLSQLYGEDRSGA